jgi:hypothetical protein
MKSFVDETTHFVNMIKDINIDTNDMLMSFDIVSLFMKIPIDEAVEFIKGITYEGKS